MTMLLSFGVSYYNYVTKPGFFYWVGWVFEIVQTKLFAISNTFWCDFTVHVTCGYISNHCIIYMDLTFASKKMMAG